MTYQTPVTKVVPIGFALSESVVLGTSQELRLSNSPNWDFHVERMRCNIPFNGCVYITDLKIAGRSMIIGNGEIDCVFLSGDKPLALDATATVGQSIQIFGRYCGHCPPGYITRTPYTISFFFTGKGLLP